MTVAIPDSSFEQWRDRARELLSRGVPPHEVQWADPRDQQQPLTLTPTSVITERPAAITGRVPSAFVAGGKLVACHRDASRWTLLYQLLWRITHGEQKLLDDPLDEAASAFERMVTQVRRDEHKMHAFVRFRKVVDGDAERYIAFHRPDHFITRLAAPFFVERFRPMRWSILTPDECAHWDGSALTFTPGVEVTAAVDGDELEDVWHTYYAAIFNPARTNPRAMLRELPSRHWATLPEARLIPELIAQAPDRVQRMLTQPSAATSARPFVPEHASLDGLREAAASCRGCPLFAHATQVVFGEGPVDARLMLVGEQPGDEEDISGKPFVGPAGRVLDEAIQAAGLDRQQLYVTNAVKHFTFRREGKRRIHERPRVTDVRACRPWLSAEVEQVKPSVIVCLGSTAAQALIGPSVRIQRDRGKPASSAWARHVVPTYHPSAVLRADDAQHSDELFRWLVEDLQLAATLG
jgi:uracil-DNA glycosylase